MSASLSLRLLLALIPTRSLLLSTTKLGAHALGLEIVVGLLVLLLLSSRLYLMCRLPSHVGFKWLDIASSALRFPVWRVQETRLYSPPLIFSS